MENEKVTILMSSYNGEKYITEQIESLVQQTYPNIQILIRDDGSSDNTINIIKKFQEKYNNIKLIEGENLGFINSFFELLKISEKSDYYAYCDQDDVWMKDKIERAVSFLKKEPKEIPLLYFSNSDYYDTDMNFLATAEREKIYNFRNSLVECVTQGMTMVINETTRNTIVENKPEHCLYHDWWTYMICSGFGKIIYDNKSLVKYRRHNKSVTVEGKNFIELFIFRVKKFLIGDSLKQIKLQWKDFERFFYKNLNDENKELLKLFTHKYNLFIALRKIFYPKRFRKKFIDELSVRLLFLFGKL